MKDVIFIFTLLCTFFTLATILGELRLSKDARYKISEAYDKHLLHLYPKDISFDIIGSLILCIVMLLIYFG